MIPKKSVGIVAYGAYLPRYVVLASEIAQAQDKQDTDTAKCLGVVQKTVPDIDEDTATMAVEATAQALARWGGNLQQIGGLFIGSESHPYAVKPTGTMVKQALELPEQMAVADLQFACKAGTQALQIGVSYVLSNMAKYTLAVGSDTAQSQPGDVLEFTAASGAVCYLLGQENILVKLLATTSIVTDTPDFWRRHGQSHPQHAGRFSGEPGYFYHVEKATRLLLDEVKLTPQQIDYSVFHTPNSKFPRAAAKKLGFTDQQLAPGFIVSQVGNTYAAASLLALAAVLDQATAGQKILVTSYGSGAGADSFLFEVTDLLEEQRKNWPWLIQDYIQNFKEISYAQYIKNTNSIL